MKFCLSCQKTFSGDDWTCPACGHPLGNIGGFAFFASESAAFNEHSCPDSFERLVPLEEAHFWFRVRNDLILWALDHWCALRAKMMEIGCGTGFVLSRIERDFSQIELCGAKIYSRGLEFASKRLQRSELIQMDALSIPYRDEFDIIGMFNTLEHIREDEKVLDRVRQALAPDGRFLLTVPQHPFLWSYLDEISGHARRYRRKELTEKIRKASFQVVMVSSFVFFLLPILLALRMGKRKNGVHFNPGAEFKIHPAVNFIFEAVLALEYLAIGVGSRFPWGESLIPAVRKA